MPTQRIVLLKEAHLAYATGALKPTGACELAAVNTLEGTHEERSLFPRKSVFLARSLSDIAEMFRFWGCPNPSSRGDR